MKKFNQTITVEVSVDSIAEQLLSHLDPQFKHREAVVESIIGPLVDKGNVSYVYNALNGYTNDIDFKVGDIINCTERTYTHEVDAAGNISPRTVHTIIGKAKVININLFSKTKLEIEFTTIDGKGEAVATTDWVSHRECSHIVVEPTHNGCIDPEETSCGKER